jgi:hypothetical protein
MRRSTTQDQKDFAAAVAKGAQVREGSQQLATRLQCRPAGGHHRSRLLRIVTGSACC